MVEALRSGCVAALCCWVLDASAAPTPSVPPAVIPPGYHPVQARDERGLWLELEDYEKALSRSALRVRDRSLNDYIEGLVCKIASDYCPDFRVYVMRNPSFNASMTANGMMQVWTGLLTRVGSEDELATVLGHEIAHYERAHTLAQFRKMKKDMAVGSVFDFGLLLIGVPVPAGRMTAILNVLAFSREEEQEADLLGAKLMADAGYDPHSTYRIWRNLIDEDAHAEIKREEPSPFARTHPDSEVRAQTLETWVGAAYGDALRPVDETRFQAIVAKNIDWLMDDQIKTGRYGRTEYLLGRQEALGMAPGALHFYRAQMIQQRGAVGDDAAAKAEYELSVAAPGVPAPAFRNLGYLLWKENNTIGARVQFARYLEAEPGASDRAMIESYLTAEVTP